MNDANMSGKSNKIVYPPGCKDITEEMGKEELVRRLKVMFVITLPVYVFILQKLLAKPIFKYNCNEKSINVKLAQSDFYWPGHRQKHQY